MKKTRTVVFTPAHRIGALLRADGGVSVAQALARADRRLDSIRDDCLGALDDKIDALAAVSSADHGARAYALATEIYGLVGTFGLKELAEAANSLCELLAARAPSGEAATFQATDKFAESIRVHVDALRTLRRPELSGDSEARAAVVAGLRRLVSSTTP